MNSTCDLDKHGFSLPDGASLGGVGNHSNFIDVSKLIQFYFDASVQSQEAVRYPLSSTICINVVRENFVEISIR